MRIRHLLASLVVLGTLGLRPGAGADTTPAIVTGAELLYVRRGAGTEFAAFATVQKGERLEVTRLEGVWAQVQLTSGQVGYVHSNFLTFPDQPPALVVIPPTLVPTHTETATPTASPEPIPATATGSPSAEATPSVPPPPVSEGPPVDESPEASLRREVRELNAAIAALNNRLDALPATVSTQREPAETTWSSPSVAVFILVALLVGWVAGGATGRQGERGRRGRIRL